MSKFVDVSGLRFGKWLAVKPLGRSRWRCLCICGSTGVVILFDLRSGKSKQCRSCSSSLPKGEAGFNSLYTAYKRKAKHRGLMWALSKRRFRKLTKDTCWYCGVSPENSFNRKGTNGCYIYNGVDRLVNSQGYTYHNSVSCCAVCNRMKMALPLRLFLEKCRMVAKLHKENIS